MNFFKMYIGDYQRDTGSLSIAEHGAYFLMLQYHYATEKPIPAGKELYRMLRCESKSDREAVDSVAHKFWTETPAGLVNERATEEISLADEANNGAKDRKKNERERQKRHREHRKQMYEMLRTRGITPPFSATTEELNALLCCDITVTRNGDNNVAVTRDITATRHHNHNQKELKSKALSVSTDPGFLRFWESWPKSERKQGKADCKRIWQRKNLEPLADVIVAHVLHMANSATWKGGYDPMPKTYLNQDRWDGADLTASPSGVPDYSQIQVTDGV